MIVNHCGQPSYVLANSNVKATVTVQGGHLLATFVHGEREVSPFFVSPWWSEPRLPGGEDIEILRVLRGDFFCLPFGANSEPFNGKKYPVHGLTANGGWELDARSKGGEDRDLTLVLALGEGSARVRKTVGIRSGQPLVYCEHVVSGLSGRMPVGHHQVLQFPDSPGAGIIDVSQPLACFTNPEVLEDPGTRGYSLLQPDVEVADPRHAPTVFGDTVDLMRYPLRPGFEDVFMFCSDPQAELCFSSISFPQQGYLYFQLKDPRQLSGTLFWRSNGGRHYPPWSGRVRGVLGMEEVTAYFALGIKRSVESNPLQKRGLRTCVEFDAGRPTAFRMIMGCVPIPPDFTGVKDIRRKDAQSILIEARTGPRLEVPCRVDYLQQGQGAG